METISNIPTVQNLPHPSNFTLLFFSKEETVQISFIEIPVGHCVIFLGLFGQKKSSFPHQNLHEGPIDVIFNLEGPPIVLNYFIIQIDQLFLLNVFVEFLDHHSFSILILTPFLDVVCGWFDVPCMLEEDIWIRKCLLGRFLQNMLSCP